MAGRLGAPGGGGGARGAVGRGGLPLAAAGSPSELACARAAAVASSGLPVAHCCTAGTDAVACMQTRRSPYCHIALTMLLHSAHAQHACLLTSLPHWTDLTIADAMPPTDSAWAMASEMTGLTPGHLQSEHLITSQDLECNLLLLQCALERD
jgi:hypothetical protein